jgi:hypothetical protein
MTDAVAEVGLTTGSAPSEQGWTRILLALAAFLLLPSVPQFRAFLPVERTILMLVPALAACCLVGWWAGGRAVLALAWIAIATILATQSAPANDSFFNLVRGWSLLLGGSFGLVCLFGSAGSFFPRALVALGLSLVLAIFMSSLGPVTASEARKALSDELARRNTETMSIVNAQVETPLWNRVSATVPQLDSAPAIIERRLKVNATAGLVVFPALLALESLAALALAWSLYHRLGRARLGQPFGRLRDFRFNDQLVWGLIVGITLVFLPSLANLRGLGFNLLVFFGALYALRGLGVIMWFLSPGTVAVTISICLALLWDPLLMSLALAGLGVGLSDTWANWRKRARPTP